MTRILPLLTGATLLFATVAEARDCTTVPDNLVGPACAVPDAASIMEWSVELGANEMFDAVTGNPAPALFVEQVGDEVIVASPCFPLGTDTEVTVAMDVRPDTDFVECEVEIAYFDSSCTTFVPSSDFFGPFPVPNATWTELSGTATSPMSGIDSAQVLLLCAIPMRGTWGAHFDNAIAHEGPNVPVELLGFRID